VNTSVGDRAFPCPLKCAGRLAKVGDLGAHGDDFCIGNHPDQAHGGVVAVRRMRRMTAKYIQGRPAQRSRLFTHWSTKRFASPWNCRHRFGSIVMGQGLSAMALRPATQSVGMSVRDGVIENGRWISSASSCNEAMERKAELVFSARCAAKVAKPAKVIGRASFSVPSLATLAGLSGVKLL
jgi:hypothetical protein